jgi:hypothetical protein
MVIKYTNIFLSKTLQNLPKLGVLVWKQTIWQPWPADVWHVLNLPKSWFQWKTIETWWRGIPLWKDNRYLSEWLIGKTRNVVYVVQWWPGSDSTKLHFGRKIFFLKLLTTFQPNSNRYTYIYLSMYYGKQLLIFLCIIKPNNGILTNLNSSKLR